MSTDPAPDKVALVTGGARRLGAVIADRLHRAGMKIVVHYRGSGDDARALRDTLNGRRPESAALLQADLLDPASPRELVDGVIAAFGRLDIVINNASAFYPTPVGGTTQDDWDAIMGPNLRAPFFLIQKAAAELTRNRGCVVNMADIYAHSPLAGHLVYSTAKAGLIALTRALAGELAPHVRVNAVAPGAILWPEEGGDRTLQERILRETPLERTGSPEEIAEAVLFLATAAGFTTGHVLPVDGGRSYAR